jgi:hypothetical protein
MIAKLTPEERVIVRACVEGSVLRGTQAAPLMQWMLVVTRWHADGVDRWGATLAPLHGSGIGLQDGPGHCYSLAYDGAPGHADIDVVTSILCEEIERVPALLSGEEVVMEPEAGPVLTRAHAAVEFPACAPDCIRDALAICVVSRDRGCALRIGVRLGEVEAEIAAHVWYDEASERVQVRGLIVAEFGVAPLRPISVSAARGEMSRGAVVVLDALALDMAGGAE